MDAIGAERIQASPAYARAVAELVPSQRPGVTAENVEQLRMAAAIMADTGLHTAGREKLGTAAFDDALFDLQRQYGEILPDFRPAAVPVSAKSLPLAERERAQLRELAGENADKPVGRVGDEATFRDASGKTMVMDASREPPRVFRETGGIRAEMPGVSDSFARLHGFAEDLERIGRTLASHTESREKIVGAVIKLAENARVAVSEDEAKDPMKLVERVRVELERKRDEADRGNPPVNSVDGDTSGALVSFDDLATAAERDPPDRRAAEIFAARLVQLEELGEHLDKNAEVIREAEAERGRIEGAIATARAEYDETIRTADEQASANIARLRDAGGDLLGNVGITAIIDLLNSPPVRAVRGNPDEIDLAKPLKDEHRAGFAWAMGTLFGDVGLYTPDGDLTPAVLAHPEGLRARLIDRKILGMDGTPNLYEMEKAIRKGVEDRLKNGR